MPLYMYKAFTKTGKKEKGILIADHVQAASAILEEKGWVIADLRLQSIFKRKKSSFSKADIFYFTQSLTKLLQAGLPLYEALLALEEKYRSHKMHPVILDISDQIHKGSSFSKALFSHEDIFDFLYCSMVKNAEQSGNMVPILQEICQLLLRQMKLKKQLITAILYPAILCGFSIFVVAGLLFFVIPSLFDLFEGREALHPLTKVVLTTSRWVNAKKLLLFINIFIFFLSLTFLFYWEKSRKIMQRLLYSLPIVKENLIKVAMIRFCRSFSTLLTGGVSFIEAMELSRKGMKHPLLEEELEVAQDLVMQGKKLSETLQNTKSQNIPKLVSRMLSVAEEGGGVPTMLQHVAEIYEDEMQRNLSRFAAIIQPILLLALGLIVGFIVLAVLLPLTDVSSFISG